MKTHSLLFLAVATSMMLAACSKDNGQVVDDGQIRLSTANILSETRTTSQELQLTQFANNEKIDIFLVESVNGSATLTGDNVTSYTQPLTYTANGSGGLKVVDVNNSGNEVPQYWPTSGNGLFIYGVYPSGSASAYNETSKEFTVKTDQSSEADYKASDLMAGAPSGNPVARSNGTTVNLTFKHLLTKINIDLEVGDGFSSGNLDNAKVSILNTKPTAVFSVQGTSATCKSDSNTATPIIACNEIGSNLKCSAIIVPQGLNSGTDFIKVEVGGGSYIYKLAAQTTFGGASVYSYKIKVNKTGLTVTSSITAWTSVGNDPTSGTATLQ